MVVRPCPRCAVEWVDHASAVAQIHLPELARQQLVAALLARRHLILSGPSGIGKLRFAKSLAGAIAHDTNGEVRAIQGHPWWAINTGNVSGFVTMQMGFSLQRLFDFVEPVLSADRETFGNRSGTSRPCLVAYIERMSPAEIDIYFGRFVPWLMHRAVGERAATWPDSVLLIGTYDTGAQPLADDHVNGAAATIHLDRYSPSVNDRDAENGGRVRHDQTTYAWFRP